MLHHGSLPGTTSLESMVHARRLTGALLVAATSLALAAPPATAHTELTSTSPKAGTYAKRSLSVVRARFNQPIRSGRLQVLRAGKKVSEGSGRRSPDNVRTIEARIPEELAGGVYVARWTMTAVDGHVQRGSWRFKVRPKPAATPAAVATTQASPTVEPTPSAEPTATVDPASASDDGGAGTGVLVGGLVVVGLLAAAGTVGVLRRRR